MKQKFFGGAAGFDMSLEDFRVLGLKRWKEDLLHLFVYRSKKTDEKIIPSSTGAKALALNALLRHNRSRVFKINIKMLYSLKSKDGWENFTESASFQNQVKDLRLQDKLGKQFFFAICNKYLNQLPESLRRLLKKWRKRLGI